MLTGVVTGAPQTVPLSEHDLGRFARVFEEQRPKALRLAYAMTGDASLAEDVVAEAFARTYASGRRAASASRSNTCGARS